MKKSTYRILKSLGIFLFLILFGVFIYILTRNQNPERKEMAISVDPGPFNELDNQLEHRPIGFNYHKMIEDASPDGQGQLL
jgi:hypothetical protein